MIKCNRGDVLIECEDAASTLAEFSFICSGIYKLLSDNTGNKTKSLALMHEVVEDCINNEEDDDLEILTEFIDGLSEEQLDKLYMILDGKGDIDG